jgi:hypothetical protein
MYFLGLLVLLRHAKATAALAVGTAGEQQALGYPTGECADH